MKKIWIQYGDNKPVKIRTTADDEDVSDLIRACIIDSNRRLLGLPENYGPLSLHIGDLESAALKVDMALSSLNFGFDADHALIIYAKNKENVPIQQQGTGITTTQYWRIAGSVLNSLSVKGVRYHMYQTADNLNGYYEAGKPALYYDEDGTTLNINVLFESKENALKFDSHLQNEGGTYNSPINSLEITAGITSTTTAQLGPRIYLKHYIPSDSESPPETQSILTIQFSTFEETSDEFKYQRIEKISGVFGSRGKAESCHLMSGSHCRKFHQSYGKYDNDQNNRLAMSRDLHGWFDHLNTDIPLFYLKVISISDNPIVEGRYKIGLAVVVLDKESAEMIFWRLIEGSTQTNDRLIMHTSVYVTNPKVFQKCLDWKEKEIKKKWEVGLNSPAP